MQGVSIIREEQARETKSKPVLGPKDSLGVPCPVTGVLGLYS